MGTAMHFEPEKLICAILYHDEQDFGTALAKLKELYGETDCVSEPYVFSEISPYYDKEMGGAVTRRIVSFQKCCDPARLASIKQQTNALEQSMADHGKRTVNLDPGFVSCGKMTLATTKNAGHRIALQSGIYAELTLFYARGGWNPFPWTYMDFRLPAVQAFLQQIRSVYMQQRKSWLSSD